MLNIENAKHATWLEEFNFNNCKLNRKIYGEFIADYITGEYDGFVLNLDGAWGSGKTEFLKRIYSELLQRQHPVIYIDAWESDFSKSPLTVVTSELLYQLEAFNKNISNTNAIKNIKKFCGKFLKGTAIATSAFLAEKMVNDSSIGIEFAKTMIEDTPEKYIDKLTSEYQEQTEAIKNIRSKLNELALILEKDFEAKLPVIVLIDELDRCRPTYAIEMLEVIKHFFKTDNFVFVIATDTTQLYHSITAIYGDNFDSKQYLKRFFDRRANLPSPDIECYLDALDLDFTHYDSLDLYPKIKNEKNNGFNEYIKSIALAYELKIRDIDQLINKLFSCLRTAIREKEISARHQYINIISLLVALIEFDKDYPQFFKRCNNEAHTYAFSQEIHFLNKSTFNELVEVSLMSSILYEKKHQDGFGGEYIKNEYLSYSGIMRYSNKNNSSEFTQLLATITLKIEQKRNSDENIIKYWLWPDYKKIVELAGNLS
ncbi:hypothetical protein I2494_12610 [Budviciaceae bacterium BWR-B9]|uniref:KAP NTPase domain-containing protein n=1 Tax=Limnobaculum allomyrinae TaxID=2791986 RepID=A0ABS1IS17_9GAMM|nr:MULTISPECIES: P-loop NTPase fold protein [Limnobaculum]MBK5144548.1 hypothetical protein [Limnobaculum allomyrinae]MBV7692223.1 KAP family NTPase [Limnobaculum sp. M2-1]